MNSNRKTAIIVGVLFLTSTAAIMLGGEVFIEPILSAPNFLINVSANSTQVIIGLLLALFCGAAVVGIAVMMFPILKKHNESIALGYVGFRVIEAAIIFVSEIILLSLLTLSQEYVKAGAPDASYFQTLGTLAIEGRMWGYQMVMIVCGLGGLMFCYLLYQSKLIPRFLSVLGLIGYAMLLTGALLDTFSVIDHLHGAGLIITHLPGGLFEILLPIWLIVKGFNSSAIASESAKTDINEIK